MAEITPKFSNEKPPVYETAHRLFGADWDDGAVFTYGDTIHSKERIFPDFLIHELMHVRQQLEMGKEKWWKRYFEDAEFRKTEEVEAYRAQVDYINRTVKSREHAYKMKHFLAGCLSRDYGLDIPSSQALKLISA